jgi:Family of unknown function (DUF5681)
MANKSPNSSGKTVSSYAVGYKRPPLNTRFKKGQSGNPGGRRKRKASTLDDMIAEELHSKVPFQENGVRKKSTKLRLMIKHAINQGVTGDFRTLAVLLKFDDRLKSIASRPKKSLYESLTSLENLSATELSDLYRRAVTEIE